MGIDMRCDECRWGVAFDESYFEEVFDQEAWDEAEAKYQKYEEERRAEKEAEEEEDARAIAAYDALSWWKRLFTDDPRIGIEGRGVILRWWAGLGAPHRINYYTKEVRERPRVSCRLEREAVVCDPDYWCRHFEGKDDYDV
jgi:hypothetical protein